MNPKRRDSRISLTAPHLPTPTPRMEVGEHGAALLLTWARATYDAVGAMIHRIARIFHACVHRLARQLPPARDIKTCNPAVICAPMAAEKAQKAAETTPAAAAVVVEEKEAKALALACIEIDGQRIALHVKDEVEIDDPTSASQTTRFSLMGSFCGADSVAHLDPVLTITITPEEVEYQLVDGVTGKPLGVVGGAALATVPRSKRH